MEHNQALIIDDEPDIRELLEITLNRMKIDCVCVEDLKSAKQKLQNKRFDICLTDMRLPDGDGVDFVSYIQQNYPFLPVAVITAHGNMETAINALKSGAFDFVNKPIDLEVLRRLVNTALNLDTKEDVTEKQIIGTSREMKEIRTTISKLARSQAPVYISGESGVGKELAARLIHEQGPRRDNSFIPVNCGAIPHDLMESELFGHKKGSFTGADADKKGLFQAASGGTLFLDEIAELPAHMQVKLLRSIQEKKVRPVGENREVPVDVRILSATHKDLSALVDEGRFRQDLFYRINVIELYIPPLRERPEDIALLIEHILTRYSAGDMDRLSKQAMEALLIYPFPGNVRELENILERALTLSEGGQIELEDLKLPQTAKDVNGAAMDGSDINLDQYLEQVEKDIIVDALEKTKWNKTAAARLLGVSFRALRYRLQKLGLD
ncbi:MAG: sigma-54 dependent transcriptional regulator [Gammaproteobacteria bacterium]|jgi:two-component system response regulator PilR (NtrC family)